MVKKYVCRLSATNILVKVHGQVKRLEFEPDVINEFGLIGCSYYTDDEDIQKAIEGHRNFRDGSRDGIWLKGEPFVRAEKEVVAVEPAKEPVKEPAKEDKRVECIKKKEE